MANHQVLPSLGPGVAGNETALAALGMDNVQLLRVAASLLVLLLAYLLVRLADAAFQRSARRLARLRKLDEYRTRALVGRTRPMKFAVAILAWIAGILAILAVWGLQTAFTGLLAGAGFFGIVVGLAAADTIGDIMAGFLIFFNHPFDLGDWVEVAGIEGVVHDVGLGATTIMTFDNEKVTIPNRLVEGQAVRNYTHARVLRRRLAVTVDHTADLQLAIDTLLDTARAHVDILREHEPQAVARAITAAGVELELLFWIEPTRRVAVRVQSDMVRQVHDALRKRHVGVATAAVQLVDSRPRPEASP